MSFTVSLLCGYRVRCLFLHFLDWNVFLGWGHGEDCSHRLELIETLEKFYLLLLLWTWKRLLWQGTVFSSSQINTCQPLWFLPEHVVRNWSLLKNLRTPVQANQTVNLVFWMQVDNTFLQYFSAEGVPCKGVSSDQPPSGMPGKAR